MVSPRTTHKSPVRASIQCIVERHGGDGRVTVEEKIGAVDPEMPRKPKPHGMPDIEQFPPSDASSTQVRGAYTFFGAYECPTAFPASTPL